VGKVISTYKTGKHFTVTITDTTLAVARKQDQIDAEAALDGFYVLRTPIPAAELDAPAVVAAYKNLKYVERDFRHIKSDDLDLRPVFHRLEERVKAHVLICMLACYLTWHLRRAWAPLTFTDVLTTATRPGWFGRTAGLLATASTSASGRCGSRCRSAPWLTHSRLRAWATARCSPLARTHVAAGYDEPGPGPVMASTVYH
jgi:hypothetical protein